MCQESSYRLRTSSLNPSLLGRWSRKLQKMGALNIYPPPFRRIWVCSRQKKYHGQEVANITKGFTDKHHTSTLIPISPDNHMLIDCMNKLQECKVPCSTRNTLHLSWRGMFSWMYLCACRSCQIVRLDANGFMEHSCRGLVRPFVRGILWDPSCH